MLVSPKWQTMWMDSQYCSKNIVSLSLPSQAKKILEELKTNCSSPHKAVQLEALRCWGSWINTQNPEDWKLNTVCYAAVRPLHGKKLQPLYKDADICKLKLSLIWGLIVKVQSIVQLEGPQYIVEIFIQFCLTWLSSSDVIDDEVSVLIFQLILSLYQKEESWNICDEESFPSLSTEVLSVKKVFQNFADKLCNFFMYWKKVTDKTVILKIWKCFLRNCEESCDNIPTLIWHKIFKMLAQICTEDSQSIKDRLGFLHGCATTLKTVLPSSKFIDYGNLLITPCEALLKKLVDLCVISCEEDCHLEMFNLSQGICRVLLCESEKLDGYEQCFYVMDMLEDFSLKSLFWGVWCGLVHCFQTWLEGVDRSQYTKIQMKFYRKLRGFAVNFDLDYKYLPKDCLVEVENHIRILNITCVSCLGMPVISVNSEVKSTDTKLLELSDKHETISSVASKEMVPVTNIFGQFSTVSIYSKPNGSHLGKVLTLKLDFLKDILKVSNMAPIRPLLSMFNFRLLTLKTVQEDNKTQKSIAFEIKKTIQSKDFDDGKKKKSDSSKKSNAVVSCERKTRSESAEELVSTPRTRSRKRAEEEINKELEDTPRKRRRKSFEIIVQEIFEKNKLRKTEKSTRKKSPVGANKKEKRKRKTTEEEKEKEETSTKRVLRNSNQNESKSQKEKKPKVVTDGRLENYFKVITKKPLNGIKNVNEKKTKKKTEISRENKEIGWKQTSLKMVMTPEDKTEGGKIDAKAGSKVKSIVDTPKKRKEKRVIEGKDMAKLSPYKEVLHDHEYAKIESQNESFTSDVEDKLKTVAENTEAAGERKPLVEIQQLEEERTPVKKIEIQTLQEVIPVSLTQLIEDKETVDNKEETSERVLDVKQSETEQPTEKTDLRTPNIDATANEVDTLKRGKKRRMLDSLKPNKKMKLSVGENKEENVPSTVDVPEEEKCEEKVQSENLTEKENKASPIKAEEKEVVSILKVKGDASPKTANGSISSRALRMIALLPESTMLGQVHREPTCKAEVAKCKKAPNVNVNSRASKMLALLSGNGAKEVEEVEETDNEKAEECSSVTKTTTPIVKTPVSTLKSPNSVKKRKSIMFDDAKNETILYEIDTPPSKILEERKKFQINRLQEIASTAIP